MAQNQTSWRGETHAIAPHAFAFAHHLFQRADAQQLAFFHDGDVGADFFQVGKKCARL